MVSKIHRAGLARNILIFFAGIGAAGLLIGVLNDPFHTLLGTAETLGDTGHAAQGRGYIERFWDALPFIVVGLAFIQLLGAAAAERRVGQ